MVAPLGAKLQGVEYTYIKMTFYLPLKWKKNRCILFVEMLMRDVLIFFFRGHVLID
jgi:hypothetical protein